MGPGLRLSTTRTRHDRGSMPGQGRLGTRFPGLPRSVVCQSAGTLRPGSARFGPNWHHQLTGFDTWPGSADSCSRAPQSEARKQPALVERLEKFHREVGALRMCI
jgi:hypothetical protein